MSVFINTLMGILKDYAAAAPSTPSCHTDQHPTDLAILQGALAHQLVTAELADRPRVVRYQRLAGTVGYDSFGAAANSTLSAKANSRCTASGTTRGRKGSFP